MDAGTVAGPPPSGPIHLILFDLDGTLLDTAPDLARALNQLLAEQGRRPLAPARIRPSVSHGSPGLLRVGFGIERDHPDFERLRARLLAIYRDGLAMDTTLFEGMGEALAGLAARGLRWGVVTNKPGWLTDPLLEALGLATAAACVVSGDTIVERKPDPAPLLHACRLAGTQPAECVYIGDAHRDIDAARRAGMHSLIAGYGYLGDDDEPLAWGADHTLAHPGELLEWLDARAARAADA